MSEPPRIVSWLAHGIASSLDAFFLNRFEQQRAEYWQTLYSTVVSNFVYILLSLVVYFLYSHLSSTTILMQSMKAPYLILCSENDDLAPYQTICNFAQRLQELGADVKVVKWNGSPHVGLLLNFITLWI